MAANSRSAVGRSRPSRNDSAARRVRDSAVSLLERSERSLAPLDVPLRLAVAQADPRHRGLLQQLVLGTVSWRRRLDAVLETVADRRIEEIDAPLRWPFRVALFQLFFLDRTPPHAIVNEAVEQAARATHRGGASFVNAVLRRVARKRSLAAWPVRERDEIRRLAIETSHPDFLVRRWVAEFGERRTQEILAANNEPKTMHLLALRDRGGREQLAERLIDEDVCVEPSALAPCGLIVRAGRPLETEAFAEGGFYIQDEASQVAALVPPPRVGERVLDVAAAPGGKTFSLLAYQPLLDVVASDVSLARLISMHTNRTRLRLEKESLQLVLTDGLSSAISGSFDRVVVDVPCSGTGTLRKNPELKWRLQESQIADLERQAAALAVQAAQRVTPGGLLILISCSIERSEVEVPLQEVLGSGLGFETYALEPHREYHVRQGLTDRTGVWQILPEADHDGFTVAVGRRRSQ